MSDFHNRSTEHLNNLLLRYIARLEHLELQEAELGDLHVPPHTSLEIQRLTNQIQKIEAELARRKATDVTNPSSSKIHQM